MQQNVFSDLFFVIGRGPNSIFNVNDSTTNWDLETLLLSKAIYTLSFWIGAWIFLRRYRRQIADYEDYIHTGNDFLDIVIRDKARQAKVDEVDFSAVIHFEQGGFLEPIDISTIFGNALDNALEASLKLPPEQRLVTVRAECVRDMLSVVVENNCLPGETGYEKTSKEDKFLHGFGISNIKQAVEKYPGQCLVRQGKECFQLKILLPLP